MSNTKITHSFTADPERWCPCGPFPLVELGADANGPVEVPQWFVRLPCAQERTLLKLARAARVTREEWIARTLAVALNGPGGES